MNLATHAPPGLQVFLKQPSGNGRRQCWRSKRFLRLRAGCHHVSVTHAHTGGPHGITLRVQTKHAWKCARSATQRIPVAHVQHPRGCACDDLPPDSPIDIDPMPSPPPPPATSNELDSCPPAGLQTPGWLLCAWDTPFRDRKWDVPRGAVDLEGIAGLDVRSRRLSIALHVRLLCC